MAMKYDLKSHDRSIIVDMEKVVDGDRIFYQVKEEVNTPEHLD